VGFRELPLVIAVLCRLSDLVVYGGPTAVSGGYWVRRMATSSLLPLRLRDARLGTSESAEDDVAGEAAAVGARDVIAGGSWMDASAPVPVPVLALVTPMRPVGTDPVAFQTDGDIGALRGGGDGDRGCVLGDFITQLVT
jgi:hypothetical protein